MSHTNNQKVDVPYEHVYLNPNGIFVVNTEGNEKIADYIAIKKLYRNIDTSDIVAEVEYDSLKKRRTIKIPRTDYMNALKLILYSGKGLDLMKDTIDDIVKHFRNQEELADVEHLHSNIGFGDFEGKEIYKLYRSIGVDSVYCGPYALEPKGDKETYLKMLDEQVMRHAPLELIFIMALSAITVGFIGEELSLDTTIIHLKGNSTTGKTTAVRLGISAFGYADTRNNGLFSTYNATANALIKQLAGIKGVPFAFDEISMSQVKDLTSIIYTIANGTDKARLSSTAELKQKSTWHTTVFSTGEKSLIGSAKNNVGVQNRVIELDDIVFTKDAGNALEISKVIQGNYGHLAYDFVDHVFAKGKDYFIKNYNIHYKRVLKILKKFNVVDQFTERRAKNFAVMMLTAKELEQVLDKKFDWNGILKIIIETEKKALLKRNFDKASIDYIKQFLNVNYSKFLIQGEEEKNNGTCWGKIIKKKDCVEIEMLPIKFKQMLEQGGFEDENIVLKELKKSGFLNCEKDRYTRKRRIKVGVPTDVYVICVPKSQNQDVETG